MRRAVGAAIGIYGNSKEEAYYTAYNVDADKQALDGSKTYVLHFSKEQVPPVKFFWSMLGRFVRSYDCKEDGNEHSIAAPCWRVAHCC